MGWYHSVQILAKRVPSAQLTTVIESYLVSGKASGPPLDAFNKYRAKIEAQGVFFANNVDKIDPVNPS